MKRILPLLALGAAAALPALADDSGLRLGASVEKDITKKFSIEAGLEGRLEDHWSRVTRYDASLGLGLKPTKWLGLGAGYVFIRDYSPSETKVNFTNSGRENGLNVDEDYWRNKHRFVFDVTGKHKFGRFTLSLRERYQYTHYAETTIDRTRYRDELPAGMDPNDWTGSDLYPYDGRYFTEMEIGKDTKKAKDRHYLRSRLQVEYNIKSCPWTPYASYELSNNLGEKWHLDKQRLTIGAEWKITKKHHRLDFAYLYDNGHDDDTNSDIHSIQIGYKFKF